MSFHVSRTALIALATLAAGAASVHAATIDFVAHKNTPATTGNPLAVVGTSAGVNWTLNSGGTDLFKNPWIDGESVNYTHNSTAGGGTRGGSFEVVFAQPVEGLTFSLVSFGSRVINYGPTNSNNSGGQQRFTLEAFNGANPIDLALGNAASGSLVSISDLGTSLRGDAVVFDAQGANSVGSNDRYVDFTVAGPATRFTFTFLDQAISTGFIGDSITLRSVAWTAAQTPEPTILTIMAGFGGLAMRRRR